MGTWALDGGGGSWGSMGRWPEPRGRGAEGRGGRGHGLQPKLEVNVSQGHITPWPHLYPNKHTSSDN